MTAAGRPGIGSAGPLNVGDVAPAPLIGGEDFILRPNRCPTALRRKASSSIGGCSVVRNLESESHRSHPKVPRLFFIPVVAASTSRATDHHWGGPKSGSVFDGVS